MRVLILADSCNPDWPSLPAVAYRAAKAISERVDVTVVTSVRNRENIEKAGFGRAQVDYVDTEYVAVPLEKVLRALRGSEGAWTAVVALTYPSYLAFERDTYRRYRSRLEQRHFDIVHRISPMSPALPSYMAVRLRRKHKVPFVVGPLNGGLRWPAEFSAERRQEREWLSYLRTAYKLLPYYRSTYRDATAVLASFRHTIEYLPATALSRIVDFPEVGFDPNMFSTPDRRKRKAEKTILVAGRMVPYKLPDVTVDAFVRSAVLRQHRLVVVGDGPLVEPMREQVRAAGLDDRVEFTGRVDQPTVGEWMRKADIFSFPTIRELGAGALVEAMACGLACVTVDYGAPAALIDGDRGVKVPLGNKETVTVEVQRALEALVTDDHRLYSLGINARKHVESIYSWHAKADFTVRVYDWVLGRAAKPDFWAPRTV